VFGRLDDLRARGAERVQQLQQNGYNDANFTTLRKLPSAAFTQRKSRLEIGHVLFSRLAAFGEVMT
jgi:hypothetical protein